MKSLLLLLLSTPSWALSITPNGAAAVAAEDITPNSVTSSSVTTNTLYWGVPPTVSSGSSNGSATLASGAALTVSGANGNVIGASSVTTTGSLFGAAAVIGSGAALSTFTSTALTLAQGAAFTAQAAAITTLTSSLTVTNLLLVSPAATVTAQFKNTTASGNTQVQIQNAAANQGVWGVNNGGPAYIGSASNVAFAFLQNNGTAATFDTNKNFGLNDTTPDAQLDILSNAAPTGYILAVSSQNDTNAGIMGIQGNGSVSFSATAPVTISSAAFIGVSVSSIAAGGAGASVTTLCLAGTFAMGGGCSCSGAVAETANISTPNCTTFGCVPTGWTCQVSGGTGGACSAYAVCSRAQ